MKKAALLLPFLALAPLSANSWEAGLFVGQQSLRSDSLTLPGGSSSFNPDSKAAVGIRIGRSVVDIGPVLLTVTAGYQPEVKQTVKATYTTLVAPTEGNPMGGTLTDHLDLEYKSSHASVGAMFTLRSFVAVGAGVEYRFEHLKMETSSTNYTRPWARVNLGISLPTPILKPFVGLEAAVPLVSKSLSSTHGSDEALKALAPKLQVGLYGGIRF